MESCIKFIWMFKVFLLFCQIVNIMAEGQTFYLHNAKHLMSPIFTTVRATSEIKCAAHCLKLQESCIVSSYDNTSHECRMSENTFCDTVTQTKEGSTLMMKEEKVCDKNWTMFDGHCYYFELGVKKNWWDAKNECKKLGGYFLKIDNECENNWIKSVLRESSDWSVWIGGNDVAKDGQFVWTVDGSNIIFSDWAFGEPNSHGIENCMDMRFEANFMWNDQRCEKDGYFICKQ